MVIKNLIQLAHCNVDKAVVDIPEAERRKISALSVKIE